MAVAMLLGGGAMAVLGHEGSGDSLIAASGDSAAGDEAATTPVVVPDGWHTVGGASLGFTLALPPDWTDLPLSGATLDGLNLNPVLKANPPLADALNGQLRTILQNGGKLFAFQNSAGGAVNINLIATPSGGASLAEISAVLPVEITDAGARDLRTEKVKLPAGDAFRLVYTLPFNVPGGGKVNVEQSQYVVVRGQEAFILTVSTPNRARDGATLDAIAQTLSFA